MATDNLALETNDEKNNIDIDIAPTKKIKRGRRNFPPTNSNGIMENGNGNNNNSLTETNNSTKLPKYFDIKNVNESTLESSIEQNFKNNNIHQLKQTLTPVESFQSTSTNKENEQKFQQIELSTVTDDEDEREQRRDLTPIHHTLTGHDTMVSSYTTGGDNDVIEIHEFSLADIDAYLDIYFETLDNRLRHFIGENDQLQQFRLAMKNRINSDTNSREFQNVLLGKMNGEVLAAVTLSFPGETTTISNTNILPQTNSCLTSISRWMIRNANYIPTNMDECYIEMIGVKSAYRNHGIGAAMLECVEQFARQAGAHLLTIHINSEQLRNYFQRFGFNMDHSDNSAFWKWIVERQNINKMSKMIPPDDGNNDYPMDNTSSYINGSTLESERE